MHDAEQQQIILHVSTGTGLKINVQRIEYDKAIVPKSAITLYYRVLNFIATLCTTVPTHLLRHRTLEISENFSPTTPISYNFTVLKYRPSTSTQASNLDKIIFGHSCLKTAKSCP
jgi:hypothetical protein